MMHHSAFLFDYIAFKAYIKPFVASLDKGDVLPLLDDAKTIIENVDPDNWVLKDKGTSLESYEANEINNQSDIGYLLLVVLSKFLRPAPNLDNWGILSMNLKTNFKWSKEEIELLIHGNRMSLLLKPNEVSPKELTVNHPYWFWMFPTQSHKNGWLSLDEVIRLLNKINSIRNQVISFTSQRELFNLSTNDLNAFRNSIDEAIFMLGTAKEANQGLFLVIDY